MQTFVILKKNVPMVSLFVKWLIFPLVLVNAYKQQTNDTEKVLHPFYLAVTEINENKKEHSLEITVKMFVDDFEKVLAASYKEKVDLVNPNRTTMDKLVSDYLKKRLQLIVNDKIVAAHYLGFQQEDESVYCFLEVTGAQDIKKLIVRNKLLHDLNESQINIIHTAINGNRKSTKLDYPKDIADFKW